MSECPSREHLARFLEEFLVGPEADLIVEHVEVCAGCQETLNGLSSKDGTSDPATNDHGAQVVTYEPTSTFLSKLRQGVLDRTDVFRNDADARYSRPLSNGECSRINEEWRPHVAGYEILSELGRGGMGVVYLARQHDLDRLVAIKILLAGAHASPHDLARFRVEAETVARLRHPNIVQIYEIGNDNGCPYFALEHVEGGSLAKRVHGTPMPAREAAELVEMLARAIHAAHQRGIVHRDLKPANVLLTADGNPKISDFGLAKRLDLAVANTQTGAVLGTPEFMAPEQAEGRVVGPPADIHALGAILYLLLTGRPPFIAETPLDSLLRVRHEEAVAPSLLQPRVPRDLGMICLKCLRKEPRQRYASAEALALDLQRFLEGKPIQARPTPVWERMVKWVRRRPTQAALIAVSMAALLALAIGGFIAQGLRDETEITRKNQLIAQENEKKAQEQEAAANKDRDKAKAEAETARRLAYGGDMRLAYRELTDSHNIPRVLRMLDQYSQVPSGQTDLRGWEWYYLRGQCYRGKVVFGLGRGCRFFGLTASPDDRWVAGANEQGQVCVWQSTTTGGGMKFPVKELAGHKGGAFQVAFSPDSRYLASCGADQTVRIWSSSDWHQAAELAGHAATVHSLAFAPDTRSLATCGADGTVRIWKVRPEASSWPLLQVLRGHEGAVYGVAYAPDSRHLATGGADGTVYLWRCEDGMPVHLFRGLQGKVNSVAFSPDGKHLASAGDDRNVHLWDVAQRRETMTLRGHPEEVRSVAFRPDGRQLASAAFDGCVRLWDLTAGKDTSCLVGHWDMHVNGVTYLPDGAHALSSSDDGILRLWNTTEPTPNWRVLPGQGGDITCAAFFDKGPIILATGSTDESVFIWDLSTGEILHGLQVHGGPLKALAFSLDGKTLATTTEKGKLSFWDVVKGKELHTFPTWTNAIHALVFSPDGKMLVAAGAGTGPSGKGPDFPIKVWNVESRKEVKSLLGHKGLVTTLAFNPRNGRLVSGSNDKTVREWDLESGTHRTILEKAPGWLYALAVHPDGRQLATVTLTAWEVHTWDMETGKQTQRIMLHQRSITGLAYSESGNRLFTTSLDKLLKVCDANGGGLELLTLRCHDQEILGLALSPNYRYLASVGRNGEIRVCQAYKTDSISDSGLEITRSAKQRLAWHLREAAAAQSENQKLAAQWHIKRLAGYLGSQLLVTP
jgi:WD40 repeat protein